MSNPNPTLNPQNLVPFTKENAGENGRKGGEASGEARRDKRTLKEVVSLLFEQEAPESVVNNIKSVLPGLDGELISMQVAMTAKIMQNVVNDGDVKAFCALRDTAGQGPSLKVGGDPDNPLPQPNINISMKDVDEWRKKLEEAGEDED